MPLQLKSIIFRNNYNIKSFHAEVSLECSTQDVSVDTVILYSEKSHYRLIPRKRLVYTPIN